MKQQTSKPKHSIVSVANFDTDEMEKFDIEYIAVDQSGKLGSLVDKRQDIIMGRVFNDLRPEMFVLNEPMVCKLYRGLTTETENLLQMVDLDDLLRVSIVLKIIQPTGIASIIDYPQSIDRYTRFLYFYHTTQHESCHDDLTKRKKSKILPVLDVPVTHIITEIISGIHAVIVLQLPIDHEDKIDRLLIQLCHSVCDNIYHLITTSTEMDSLNQIISTTVYSNIPMLNTITQFNDVWDKLLKMRDHLIEHRPVKYMLSPIEVFYPDCNINKIINSRIYGRQMKEFEQYLLQQLSEIRILKYRLNDELFESLQGKLEKQLNDLRQEFSKVTELYRNDVQNIRQITLKKHKKESMVNLIDELLRSPTQIKIKDSIQQLTIASHELVAKAILVKRIQNDGFEYCDVVKLGINEECDEQLVRNILFKNSQEKKMICLTDKLRQESLEKWNTLYSELIEEHEKNPQLNLIYADFTYSTWCLKKMKILDLKEQNIHELEFNVEPATSDEMNVEQTTSQKSKVEPTTSEEFNVGLATSDELNIEPTTSEKLNVETRTSQEFSVGTAASQKLNVEPATSQELSVGPTTSNELNAEPTISQEFNVGSAISQKLNVETRTSQEFSVAPSIPQKLDTEPATSQELSVGPTTSQELNVEPATSREKIIRTHSSPLVPTYEYINILLFGESGVGKSTFINAFANYLQFNSLQTAQSGQPIVVIPVSFLITVNENFDEKLVQFGEPDPNENHSNSGQSATQQCRSYVFDISSNKKLRIIDTPGFGDTKGNDQDDLNMQGIFSYLNNLTHLNGIYLLFKSNCGRLNPFLYPCFTQLFQYFGENIRDHFVFCFTNARTTFFTPGDTRPLLQSFLKSYVVQNIPFDKKNVFCFDSESFRYLVALQKSLSFSDDEKEEFEKSWKRSVEESNRLRNFLCENLHPYRRYIEWQSTVDAQIQINSLIRPMLETIRNITRNIILYESNASIKLKAIPFNQPTMICYTCDRTPELFNQFWILPDHTHNSSNKCLSSEQSLTEYKLRYESVNHQSKDSKDILNQQRMSIYETSIKFAWFLIKTQVRKDDLFLLGLKRMISEEESICQQQGQCPLNEQLIIELQTLKKTYDQLFNETHLGPENEILPKIYELIKLMNDIPMITEQINAIKIYQHFLLISNEYTIDVQNT